MARARDRGQQQGLLAPVPGPGPRPGHDPSSVLHCSGEPPQGKEAGRWRRKSLGGQPRHGCPRLGEGPR
eukprot:14915491-Alexandrium_andersonii.AAC.1